MPVKPVVTTHSGMTLDGRVLDWGQPIDPAALSSMRGPGGLCEMIRPGVVLTGADTLWPFPGNSVWPEGIERSPATAPIDVGADATNGPRPGGQWLAITDSRGRLPDDWFRSFLSNGTVPPWPGGPTGPLAGHHKDRELLMLVADATPPGYLAYLRAQDIKYLVVGAERVNLQVALMLFAADLGVTDVVVDGGSKLHHALLAAGLVDQVHVEIAPVILGAPGMTVFQVNEPGLPAGVTLTPARIDVAPNGTVDALYAIA
jgi:hypothetical protein